MIGNKPSAQQIVVGRIVRMAGAGLTGAVAAIGMVICLALNLRPRQTYGCVVEPGPDPIACLIIILVAGLVAALLACARTTTAGLIGSVLLVGFAMTIGPYDDFAGCLALLLAGTLLVTGVLGKCIEEFPAIRHLHDR